MKLGVKLLQPLLLLAASLLFASCWPLQIVDPLASEYENVEEAYLYRVKGRAPAPAPANGQLKVMTWNIKFGGGRIDFEQDCFGDRWTMKRSEVTANLDGLVAKINQTQPDVVIMQEVDVDSDRSANINMAKYIMDRSSLTYGAYAPHWRADKILRHGLDKMDSGNVILSRYPFHDAKRLLLVPREDIDDLYKQFYLKRNILRVTLEIPGNDDLVILNMHDEAYAKDGTKKKHIDKFKEVVDSIDAQGLRFVGGGDFNTLPPGTLQTKDFPDQVCTNPDYPRDDYSEELEYLQPLYDSYAEAIPLEDYKADNSPYFSFTATDKSNLDGSMPFWNRRLDYLFTNGTYVPGSGLVHQSVEQGGMDTMPFSDHAPITVLYDLNQ